MFGLEEEEDFDFYEPDPYPTVAVIRYQEGVKEAPFTAHFLERMIMSQMSVIVVYEDPARLQELTDAFIKPIFKDYVASAQLDTLNVTEACEYDIIILDQFSSSDLNLEMVDRFLKVNESQQFLVIPPAGYEDRFPDLEPPEVEAEAEALN